MGQFGVGQAVRRLEDQRLITGSGQYTDDISKEGQAYAVVVRSPFAHARIKEIDCAAAREMPGVLAVITGADLEADKVGTIPVLAKMPGRNGTKTLTPPYPALATDTVRHVGNPVAFVVAETLAQARDAAEAVMVDYDPLPALTETAKALEADAPQVHPEVPNNLVLDWEQGNGEETKAAFAKATKVARLNLVNNRVVVNSLEPRGCLAEFDAESGRLTLTSGNQGIFRLKPLLVAILGIEDDDLRLLCPDVGGGFGMKIFLYPEIVCALYAARKIGRPVKWTGERTESFLSDTQGRDHVTEVAIAMDDEGTFLGLKVDTVANLGAYLSNFAPYIPTGASTQMLAGLYRFPAVHAEVKCVMTHTVPVDAYRGAGRPEAAYLVERIVEEAARVAGMTPYEIRQKNFIRPEDLPFETPMGRVYDSGDFPRILKEAAERGDIAGLPQRKEEARKKGKYRGVGFACYVEACGGIGEEEAIVQADSDGGITLIIGTQTNGQGHLTAYAQMLNEKLDVPPEKVRMIQGDSDIVKRGGGTGGSRSLLMGGVAINRASDRLIERAKQIAGHVMETAAADIEFADGHFTVVGTDRRMTLGEVAQAAEAGNAPEELGGDLKESGDYTAEALTFPNGCHICELDVDEATGEIDFVRYTVVDDFGTVMNPLLCAGQVHGGTAQGLGQALLENAVYDSEGQLVSGSFMDYCMPRADDMPSIDLTFVQDVPCATNPLGVKGAGEAGCIGAPPAIINAIVDALQPLGVKTIDMPATPERIWRAMASASLPKAA